MRRAAAYGIILDVEDTSELSGHRGAAILLLPRTEDAASLALDRPGAEPAGALHVTLGYFCDDVGELPAADHLRLVAGLTRAATEIARAFDPIMVRGSGRALLGPDETEVAAVLLVRGATALQEALAEAASAAGVPAFDTYGPWLGHMTFGYGDSPSMASLLVDLDARATFIADRLAVSIGPAAPLVLSLGDAQASD